MSRDDDKRDIILHQTVISDEEGQFSGDVETPWVEIVEQTAAPALPTDKTSALLYVLAADHRLKVKLSTGTIIDLTLAGAGPLTLKGGIAVAADFPPVAGEVGGVENGWLYYVTGDVIDNAGAPLHTNTGQHVLAGSAIAWVTALAGWLDVSEQVNAQYIAATPTAIGTGDVVAMVNVAGAAVVTLPAATVGILGKKVSVHDVRGDKSVALPIAITPNGADLIDGVNVAVRIDTAYGGYELICVQLTAGPATYGWTTIVGAELKTAINDRDFAGATLGRMTRTGVGTYAVIQDNLVGAGAPAVTDDSASGYGPGSIWFDTTAHRMYVCDSAAVGAAIWVGSLSKDNVFAGAPAVGSDNLLGYSVGSTWIDTVTAIRWKCQSAATGAAVWNPEVKHNIAAAVDPVVGDDTADGYAVGSIWVNTTAVPPRVFQCTNAAAGVAVWRPISRLNNYTAVIPPVVGDDDTLGYDVGSIWIDNATDLAYICTHNATGAAVWRLSLNTVAAGGELAGTYPNPTVADGVIDAANALAGAVAGLVVDKGVPSSCVIAFDNAAGVAQRPADGASYTFSIGAEALAAIEARDAPADQYDFLRSSAGAEEDDAILMAAAFAAAINANTVIGLRIRAEVYGGAGDGRWYVACYTRLQADITAGSALTCATGGGQPGVYQARATAVAASKSQLFPFAYAVTAQDVLAGEIRFSFGCTAVKAFYVDILTAVGDYTRIAWTGAPSVVGGVLLIDNAGGGTDWAAGNIIRGWLVGTVA